MSLPQQGNAPRRGRGRAARGRQLPDQGQQARVPGQVQEQPKQMPIKTQQEVMKEALAPEPSGHGDGSNESVSEVSKMFSSTKISGAARNSEARTRGSWRTSRLIYDLVKTKPDHITSKEGNYGSPVSLMANYFKLEKTKNFELYQYSVNFDPEEDRTFIKKKLMRVHESNIGTYIYNGSMLFSFDRLYPPSNKSLILTSKSDGCDETIYTITLRLVKEVYSLDYEFLHILNIIKNTCMEKLNLTCLGRNYYDLKEAISLREYKLELLPGYVTSIRQHENDLLMCADVTNKQVRTDTILDQIKIIYRKNPQQCVDLCKKALVGSVVFARYNNRTHRVDDIDFDKTPEYRFESKSGIVSIKDYYSQKYGLHITDEQQPLIVSRKKERDRNRGDFGQNLLLPEFCHMTGLTDEMRSDFRLTQAMAEWTRKTPEKRFECLSRLSKRLSGTPTVVEVFSKYNLKYDQNLITLQGRLMPPEKIRNSETENNFSYQVETADWSRHMQHSLYEVTNEVQCGIIVPERDFAKFNEFFSSLQKAMNTFNMKMNFSTIKLPDNRINSYLQMIDQVIAKGAQLLIIIVANNKGEIYHSIKKKTCIEKPIPSQVITCSKVLNKNKGSHLSIATKIAIQMNCKVGGVPWVLDIPLKQTMIAGYDTFHDTTRKGQSVGALVATLDHKFSKYYSTTDFHMKNMDISSKLNLMIIKALKKFFEVNNHYPLKLIFYRDGVGDGQLALVNDNEVNSIKEAIKEVGCETLLIFIIVSKRINTKIFGLQGDKKTNPHSGTVVDSVITLPERYDFFLVSQSVRQGTVNPTCYNVIHDEASLKPNFIQRLSFVLAHLYYNWSGTIRVPAPCQYAHKLAQLVGQSLHREPSEHLADLLYFL